MSWVRRYLVTARQVLDVVLRLSLIFLALRMLSFIDSPVGHLSVELVMP